MNETTTVDQRVATVREFVASVFNGHEPDLAREYMTPDVVWHGNTVGTIAGVDLLGIPASGRAVRWDAVDIYRVTDDGKISEQWAFEDMAAIGSQLGAFTLPWED
jgi:limonene-1,2-epoxide hydrolase